MVALDDGPRWMRLAMMYTTLGEAEDEAGGGGAVASTVEEGIMADVMCGTICQCTTRSNCCYAVGEGQTLLHCCCNRR